VTTVPPSDTPPTDAAADAATDAVPTMRVVAGNPTDEELAAAHAVIMAVLAEQAARGAERLEPRADRWRRSARGMRAPIAPGPGAWAATAGMRGC
jgi:hypothetical protein